MDEIKKIDDNTIVITKMVDRVVDIRNLQKILDDMILQKEEYDKVVDFKNKSPLEFQMYIAEPPSMDDEEVTRMQNLIKNYKELSITETSRDG